MPASTEELLTSLPDFRSLDFWEQFFKAQKSQAFEWYGSYAELAKLLRRLVPARSRVLIPGCGNSDLSAGLYDQGCEDITNIDFSKAVIAEMMRKNLRARPSMKWQVMDMTATKFGDHSFDIILDKGSLDALMGEESPEASSAGRRYLRETARLLRTPGSFLCITLAQQHVLQQLLRSFPVHWSIHVHPVPASPDMLSRPVQPVMVQVIAQPDAAPGQVSAEAEVVQHSLSQVPGWAPNQPQVQQIIQALEAENARRQALTPRQLAAAQEGRSASDPFAQLQPGRLQSLGLPEGSATEGREPRFRAVIVDVPASTQAAAVRDACIFIVPQGQEQAWVFASPEGQLQVASQCMSRRVILISLSRGHSFGNLQVVQSELSPLVLPLVPEAAREAAHAIPFMTSQEGLGSRTVLEDADSPLSGRIVVEDVHLTPAFVEEHKPPAGAVSRRMVFLSNQGLVQSEALMAPSLSRQALPAGTGKGKRGKKQQPNEADKESSHAAAEKHLVVDQLLSEYHKAIVAGLALSWEDGTSKQPHTALVIGLGGGCLPMYMRHIVGLSVQVVELDPVVADLASRHFGFVADEQLQVEVRDGLEAIREAGPASSPASSPDRQPAAAGLYDFLVIDAGSGDASLPMSCPPPSFLTLEVLKDMAAALKPQGLLAMNCVSRSEAAFKEAVAAVQAAFGTAWMIDIEDEVNRVVFASKGTAAQTSLQHHNRSSSILSLGSRCSSIAEDLNAYMSQLELLPARE